MSREARQDKTRSPAPNELANLYQREDILEREQHRLVDELWDVMEEQREVRAAIKRACGDKETVI